MGNFSHYPLQQAIYQKLTGDATLMALITGVFDRTPQDTNFPYISIGESAAHDWSNLGTTGTAHVLTLHVWSREGGRKQAAQIMERLYTLLHQGTLTVSGQSFVSMHFTASDIGMESDGWTYQAKMHFSVLLQSD